MVCREHNEMGHGYWSSEWQEVEFRGRLVCAHEGCAVTFCRAHRHARLRSCFDCDGQRYVAQEMGGVDAGEAEEYCQAHIHPCTRQYLQLCNGEQATLTQKERDEGKTFSDLEVFDEDEPQECGEFYCSSCIDDHKCGDNPRDYI